MFTKLKTAALSALIGLGAIAAMPATAQAEGLYLNYGSGHHSGVGIGVQIGDYDRYDYRDYRRDRRLPPRLHAEPRAGQGGAPRPAPRPCGRCRPPHHRGRGRKYGERVRITFARAPNCPVVRW